MQENINEVTNENEVNTVENVKNEFDPNNYKVMIDMIKEMDEQYKMLKEFTESNVKQYNLHPDIIEAIIPYTHEDINEMPVQDGIDFLSKFVYSDETGEKITINDIIDRNREKTTTMIDGKEVDVYDDDFSIVFKILHDIKDSSMNLYSAKLEADKLKNESKDVLNEYLNYISSNKVQENRKKRLEIMKKSLANYNEDDVKKKKMEKMIESMEASMTLSFIFTRLETLKEKEILSIKKSFFDEKRGSYIIQKFKEKIIKFGFSHNLYKYFFNIEENFLDEKYHVFNNLFLFIYMRFVAYSDPYDKRDSLFVKALTGTMANLIYHKFASTENEINFINTIKKTLDYFEEYRDYFDKNNTTHPNHEIRKKADEKHETDRKNMLIDKMKSLNISGFDESMSANELQEYLNNALDEMIKSQQEKKTSEDVDVTETEDGVTNIAPAIKEHEKVDDETNE